MGLLDHTISTRYRHNQQKPFDPSFFASPTIVDDLCTALVYGNAESTGSVAPLSLDSEDIGSFGTIGVIYLFIFIQNCRRCVDVRPSTKHNIHSSCINKPSSVVFEIVEFNVLTNIQ